MTIFPTVLVCIQGQWSRWFWAEAINGENIEEGLDGGRTVLIDVLVMVGRFSHDEDGQLMVTADQTVVKDCPAENVLFMN